MKREDKVRVVGKKREVDVSRRAIRECREWRPRSASTGHKVELHPLPSCAQRREAHFE